MTYNLSKEEEILIGNNDIFYKDLVLFLIRNSKKFIYILSIGLSISLIYALRLKNVWQGEFQIVLESESNPINNAFQSASNTFDFILNKDQSSKLDTEVEILKSPSILMPIYKKSILRDKSHPNNNKPISFRKWKGNLLVDLEKGTSVLKIKYKNKNKESIIPILNDISEVYQDYSTVNMDKTLSTGIDYLTNQIELYREKSNISYERSQKFALENDLKVVNAPPLEFGTELSRPIISNSSNIQDQTTEAAIQKRLFYQLKEYFQREDIDNEKISYLAASNQLVEESILKNLEELENEINQAKAIFTNNYSKTRKLERQREQLLNRIRESALKLITAKIDAADILIKSNKRADGVYVKFNRLNNEYLRDSYTLIDLESQLGLLNLEKAKKKEPYKLITVPTLLDQKIAPVRSRILIIHSLFLLFFASMYIYIEERIKNYVYSSKELENLIPYNLIEKIPTNIADNWNDYLEPISRLYFKDNLKTEIIQLGDIDNQLLDFFLSRLKKINPDKEIKILNNISKINNKNDQLLLIQSGKTTREDIENFKRRINYGGFSIVGWILFEETISYDQINLKN
ncbi:MULTISPECIES: GumC family protein [Prochlorococcus]|uniref:Polysaccharide chain length determinant N-terminal domain-containing protein n=1 Tax=Prochlorococcus marinus str. MIT 9314 TaxID=167548 RepID=A0A0A2AFF2_PROMR|nr:Wzz/FepE/Etk N-terminal domain-containing protein [Prochlorococcus marinus]KGG00331.1 hypothetical protein EU98_1863 [Prochlorococcus marinus str. MIT 9314]